MATKTPSKPAAKAAPKASASTSTAVAKRPNANVVSIQEQLKKQAADMADRVAPATGIAVSIKNGEFRFPDGRKTKEPIQVVVADFIAANNFYEGKFDPNAITPPGCFALGPNPMKLIPSDNSPNKQSDECRTCPMNEFGSDGAGKACKNQRVLAVLPPDGDAEAPLWKLVVPPTSVKAWDAYVRSVSSMFQMPPVSVVTTISFDDSVDYPKLIFSDPQPNENLEAHFARQAEAKELLMTEPDVSQYEAAKPAKKTAARGRR